MASNEAKARGNAAFTAQRYEEAVAAFTEGIAVDPDNHVLFSNRSGAYAAMKQFDQALEDAQKCIQLNPQFVKGYSRQGLALFNLGRLSQAKEAYQQGLTIDGNNEQLKEGLRECEESLASGNAGLKNMFGGADVWAKLAANPKTAPMLANPQMVNKIKMLQANPQMMSSFIQDPQMMTVISVMLGIDLAGAPGGDESPFGAAPPAAASKSQSTSSGVVVESDSDDEEVVKPAAKPAAAPTPAPAAAAPAKRDEPKTAGPAEQAKNAGNELYKKRQFDEAIEQYNKAISLDASNPNFLLNRAAARFEQKQYDQCIADCQAAADLAQEHHTPDTPAVLGKAYARMANSFAKQIKYEDAIKYYRKSLLEVGSNDVRSKLKEVEEAKKKKEQEDYIDPVKSAEANELGKQAFTAGKWPEAVAHYSEAIKRNPKDAKLYSNRAACYTKLMAWNEALGDCDTCMKIDPQFVKAYTRKGRIQHAMKEYHKAMETFEVALKIDPGNEDAMEARQTTREAISLANSTDEIDPERRRRAMEDPEIQQILQDPMMSRILQDLQSNPKSAQAALRDPTVNAKLNKLIAAGIIRVG